MDNASEMSTSMSQERNDPITFESLLLQEDAKISLLKFSGSEERYVFSLNQSNLAKLGSNNFTSMALGKYIYNLLYLYVCNVCSVCMYACTVCTVCIVVIMYINVY